MAQLIKLTTECQGDDCDGTAVHSLLDITHEDGGEVELDIDLCISQIVLACDTCGLKHYTGDVEILNEDEIEG